MTAKRYVKQTNIRIEYKKNFMNHGIPVSVHQSPETASSCTEEFQSSVLKI